MLMCHVPKWSSLAVQVIPGQIKQKLMALNAACPSVRDGINRIRDVGKIHISVHKLLSQLYHLSQRNTVTFLLVRGDPIPADRMRSAVRQAHTSCLTPSQDPTLIPWSQQHRSCIH